MSFTEYLGVIVRTHGLDGTVVLADHSGLLPALIKGSVVGVGYGRDHLSPHTIASASITTQRIHLRFDGIDSSEQAADLIDKAVFVTAEDAGTVDKDRYTISEIEGCTVYNSEGQNIGIITDVWLLPANDVWVVTSEGGDTTPVPVVDQFIKEVDLDRRRVTVELPDGLKNIDRTMPGDERD